MHVCCVKLVAVNGDVITHIYICMYLMYTLRLPLQLEITYPNTLGPRGVQISEKFGLLNT